MIKDKNKKFQLYEQEGIKYYLLVDIDKKQINIYKLEDGKYMLQEAEENFAFELDEDCKVVPQLKAIWNIWIIG